MSAATAQRKAELRLRLRAEARHHGNEEQSAASKAICAQLKSHKTWQEAESVLFYASLADEPNLSPLMAEGLVLGKTISLPRFQRENGGYVACEVKDPAIHLEIKQFGILEPISSCPEHPLNRLDLILVPGIGFSFAGVRLGRGKGYYDRLLTEVQGVKCGVAFDWQIIDEIPVEAHDVVLDCILTPARWLTVSGSPPK